MNCNVLEKGTAGLMFVPDPTPLDPPAARCLDQIGVPTLVLAGELDNSEILRTADVMAEAIPDAQKVTIPNAAHLPNMERSAEFNRALRDFLSSSRDD